MIEHFAAWDEIKKESYKNEGNQGNQGNREDKTNNLSRLPLVPLVAQTTSPRATRATELPKLPNCPSLGQPKKLNDITVVAQVAQVASEKGCSEKIWPSEAVRDARERAARLRAAGWTGPQARVLAGLITADRWGLPVPWEIEEGSRRLVGSATVH